MKSIGNLIVLIFFITIFIGCGGGSSSSSSFSSSSSSISGLVQKGPFKKGSIVNAYYLEAGERLVNNEYPKLITETIDNKGSFNLEIPWSGPTEYVISGEYLDENTGNYISNGELTAIINSKLGETKKVNINIFTHLAASSIKNMLKAGLEIEQATNEATLKLKELFNLNLENNIGLESLDLLDGYSQNSSDNTTLLEVSAALLNTTNPEEALNVLYEDFKDGNIDNEAIAVIDEIKEEADNIDFSKVDAILSEKTDTPIASIPNNDSKKGKLPFNHNMSFETYYDIDLSSTLTSNPIVIKDLKGSADLKITNGFYSKNNKAYTNEKTTIHLNDTIKVRHLSSSSYNSKTTTYLYIGNTKIPFESITKTDPSIVDTSPNEFNFPIKISNETFGLIESDSIVVSGLSQGVSVPISIENGAKYCINGGEWLSEPSSVINTDTVKVQVTPNNTYGGKVSKALTIGDKSAVFTVFNKLADKKPNPIYLESIYSVELDTTYETEYFILDGFDGGISIKVTNGWFKIQGQETWKTSIDEVLPAGTKVKFKYQSASTYNTEKIIEIKIGGYIQEVKIITKDDPSFTNNIPTKFEFKAKIQQDLNSFVESEELPIRGIDDTGLEIRTSDYMSINGNDWTNEAVVVYRGDKIKLRVKTANIPNAEYIAHLYYGEGVNNSFAKFKVFTKNEDLKDNTPDELKFITKVNVDLQTQISSLPVTITGIEDNTCAIVAGGSYSKNETTWQEEGEVCFNNGDTIRLRHISSKYFNTKQQTLLAFEKAEYLFETITFKAPVVIGTPKNEINQNETYIFEPVVKDFYTHSFVLENNPSWMSVDENTGKITGVPSQNDIGQSGTIILKLTNSKGISVTKEFSVLVKDINDAPILNNIWTKLKIDEYSDLKKSASALELDGENLTWKLSNNPSWLSINSQTGELSGSPRQKDVGFTRDVKVIVSDESGLFSFFTFDLTVNDVNKSALILNISDKVIEQNKELVIQALATDLDGDKLIYMVSNKPSWMTFDENTGELKGTPLEEDIGIYENVGIGVTDGKNTTSWTYFSIQVSLVKTVPSLSPLSISINEVTDINTIIGTMLFDDGNSSITSMVLSGEGAEHFSISNNGEIKLVQKVSFSQKSQYLLKVKAINNIGQSQEVELKINILAIEPLDSISFNVQVKQNQRIMTNLDSTKNVSIVSLPSYGTAQAYLIGNETWEFEYSNNSCFIGEDSFSFEQNGATGIANVTIKANIIEAVSKDFEVLSNGVLKGKQILAKEDNLNIKIKNNPSNGKVTIKEENGNFVFDYEGDKDFIGTDSFTYTLTTDINACTYSKEGTITIKVKGLDPEVKPITTASFTTIIQENTPNEVSNFAYDVAIEDDIVAITSPYKKHDGFASSGELIIYKKIDGKVQEIQRIISPTIQTDDSYARFAYSISLKDDLLAVSSFTYYKQGNNHSYRSNLNKVFVYKKNLDDSFSLIKTIASPSSNTQSHFGHKVAINKNYLLIGSKYEKFDGIDNAGLAYVYKINEGEVSNTEKILASENPYSGENFAYDLTLSDDLIIVASANSKAYLSENDNNKYGEVFIYKEQENGEFFIHQSIKPDKSIKSNNAHVSFGSSLHTDGQFLAIGAMGAKAQIDDPLSYGAVFVYAKKDDDTFSLISKVVDEDKMEDAQFGSNVAIEENYLLVYSKYSRVVSGSDLSNAYGFTHIYQYIGNGQYKKLKRVSGKKVYDTISSKYKEKPNLGYSLDISRGVIIAGAPNAIVKTSLNTLTIAGRAYILDVNVDKPYLLKDKFYVNEGNVGINTLWSSSESSLAIQGEDASFFNIDSISSWNNSAYIWLKNNSNEEEEEYVESKLIYEYPQDSDFNNIYKLDVGNIKDGQTYNFPIEINILDTLNSKVSKDTSRASYAIYRNKPDISGIMKFASDIAFGTNKVYANSTDRIFVFNRTSRDTIEDKFLDYNSAINVNQREDYNPVLMGAKDEVLVFRETENINSTLNDDQYKSYLSIYENLSLKQKILFATNTTNRDKNIRDSETKRDFTYLKQIKLSENKIFVRYQNNKYDLDDDSDDYNDNKAGIRIYGLSPNNQYEKIQDIGISVYPDSANTSYIKDFSVSGDYLIISLNYSNNFDKRDIRVYKYNSSLNSYGLVQNIEDDYYTEVFVQNKFLILKRAKSNYKDFIEVYKLDDNQNKFIKIHKLYANDAGANNLTSISNIRIDGNYLLFKFNKLVDPSDTYYDDYTYSTTSYIAIFKFDDSLNRFRFMKNLTVVGAGTYFSNLFEVDNKEIIANEVITTTDSGQLYILRFEEKID